MEKFLYYNFPLLKRKFVKLLMIMKLTLIFILLATTQLSAKSIGQNITLNCKNTPLEKAFSIIEKQSSYNFVYSKEQLKNAKNVTLQLKDAGLSSVLDKIFEPQMLSYTIIDRYIVVKEKPVVPVSNTNTQAENIIVPPPPVPIKGVVKDENGKPLSGASILIKGTKFGTTTNENGEFSLEINEQATVLIVSFVGMETKEINIKNKTEITVTLKTIVQEGQDIVVVAFGTKQKSTLIESVTKLDDDIVRDKPVNNIAFALQGQVAGVNITSGSGQPGIAPSINIRGVGSLQSGTSPLIIVDGVPGTLSVIDPNDVESISILKDAAASSIYGARAANGVIIVSTKKGKVGKLSVSYAGYVGYQKPTELFKEADAYNYAYAFNEATMYDLITPAKTTFDSTKMIFTLAQLNGWESGAVASTDWRHALFTGNDGFTQSHYVNVAGGINNGNVSLKSSFSFGYLQQNGNVANTNYSRYSLRTNNELKYNRFTVGLSVGLIKDNRYEPSSKAVGSLTQIISAINRQRPIDSVKLYDGSWNITSTNDTRNPVRQAAEGGYNNPVTYNILVNFNAAYSIIKNLTLKYTTGLNYLYYNANQFQNQLTWYDGEVTGPNNSTMSNYLDAHNMQQLDLSYTKDFSKNHHFSFIVGGQEETHSYNSQTMSRSNYINNSSNSMQLGDPSTQTNSSVTYNWALLGLFGRVNYDYAKKYLLEFNFREDGSSRLSSNKRTGFFPSVSAGWRTSEETFWSSLKSVLPEFKLRASYGILGNSNLPGSDNNALYYRDKSVVGNIYSSGLGYNYASVFDGTIYSALSIIQTPNTVATWEKTALTDIAVEGTVLNSNFSYVVDFFNKTTRGMLMTQQVSDVNGGPSYVTNIGKMRNSGIEFSLAYTHHAKSGFSYNVNANYTYLTNKILDLGGQNLAASGVYKNAVGYQLNAFYLWKSDGLLTKTEYTSRQSQDPLLTGQKWGDQRIKDINGDGIINASDKVMVNKSGAPKHLFGLNFDFNYKGFGIAGMLQGAADFYKYLGASVGYGFNSGYSITDWTINHSYNPFNESNYNTRLPRLSISNTINNTYYSNVYLFNSSYVRLKNLQVYYDLSEKVAKKLQVKSLRMYLSGQNLLTVSALPRALGIDPEVSSPTAGYPLVVIYTFGINASF